MFNKSKVAAVIGLISSVGVLSSAQAAEYEVTVTNLTFGMHFTPLIVAAHPQNVQLFAAGSPASPQLQAMAEGGDISGLAELLDSEGAAVVMGEGLLAPGTSVTFTINAEGANNHLSVASMLLPTNDGFVALNGARLTGANALYNLPGYDAGTEANDEIIGSGAPGEAGFPAPPPVVATGTGVGGTGYETPVEGFVHIHRNVLGDIDALGGLSDINAAVHRWLNPAARVSVRLLDGGADGAVDGGPSAVADLSALAYSVSAVEIFWADATSDDSFITEYEVRRDGELLISEDVRSFFEEGLEANTIFTYEVTPVDSEGRRGPATDVVVSTF